MFILDRCVLISDWKLWFWRYDNIDNYLSLMDQCTCKLWQINRSFAKRPQLILQNWESINRAMSRYCISFTICLCRSPASVVTICHLTPRGDVIPWHHVTYELADVQLIYVLLHRLIRLLLFAFFHREGGIRWKISSRFSFTTWKNRKSVLTIGMTFVKDSYSISSLILTPRSIYCSVANIIGTQLKELKDINSVLYSLSFLICKQ